MVAYGKSRETCIMCCCFMLDLTSSPMQNCDKRYFPLVALQQVTSNSGVFSILWIPVCSSLKTSHGCLLWNFGKWSTYITLIDHPRYPSKILSSVQLSLVSHSSHALFRKRNLHPQKQSLTGQSWRIFWRGDSSSFHLLKFMEVRV